MPRRGRAKVRRRAEPHPWLPTLTLLWLWSRSTSSANAAEDVLTKAGHSMTGGVPSQCGAHRLSPRSAGHPHFEQKRCTYMRMPIEQRALVVIVIYM